MAVGSSESAAVNGTTPDASKPFELAIELPHSPGLKLHLHLTILANSVLLFLTSTSSETPSTGAVPMGSFVYALPDRYNPTQPLSTPLYTAPSSQDFTTRMAKFLTRRLGRPCYVSSSINLSSAAGGGSTEEEMEAFRVIIETVVEAARRREG